MKIHLTLLLAGVLLGCRQINYGAEPALAKLAAANNEFSFKLLSQLAREQPGKNIFLSPYSAATALQMAANGAAGVTKAEMQKVLGTSALDTNELNAACKAAAALLNSKATNLILTTANALWYRQSAQIKKSFLDANRNIHSTTIKPLDFSHVPAAEKAINHWASDETHGRIDGIANGLIDPLYTDLVLANAIYFKGKWADPFDPKLTSDRPFHPAKGAVKPWPMMEESRSFSYRQGSGYQAVRLPYQGGALAMYVFLPAPGSSPGKFLQVMNGDKWRRVTMPGFKPQDGLVVLPKFKLADTYELVRPLTALGMRSAFDHTHADFSGMFGEPHAISAVRQKTFIELGEEGTEAAAVTVIGTIATSALPIRPKPFELIVDRPFLFAIVDARSEMILFLGVISEL
jgi:serpin B